MTKNLGHGMFKLWSKYTQLLNSANVPRKKTIGYIKFQKLECLDLSVTGVSVVVLLKKYVYAVVLKSFVLTNSFQVPK